jgi:hypothetical protein
VVYVASLRRVAYNGASGESDIMLEKIDFNPSLLVSHCIIDTRTPLEFSEDHLPGAFNVRF